MKKYLYSWQVGKYPTNYKHLYSKDYDTGELGLIMTYNYLSMCAVAQQNISEQQGYRLNIGVGGIVVSIAAFQAVDPGSIPGRRNNLCARVSQSF